MQPRPLWVLADAHGGADPGADHDLEALLALGAEAAVDLLVLGDLFAAWLGPARFHTPAQARVLAGVARLRAAGGRVRFVVGNRDHLVAEAQAELPFDTVHTAPEVLALAGVPTLVLHGDGVVPEDRFYRAWATLSRSAPVTHATRALPGPVGARLAERIEARLARTNRAHKTGVLPVRALEAVGREACRRAARRALVGHFHHDRILEVPGGVPVQVAPAWLEHRRVLVGTPSGDLASTPLAALRARPGG